MKSRYTFLLFFIVSAFFIGCGDRSQFTEMDTNRLIVLFKGTYESNSPRNWINPPINGTLVQDQNSVYKCTNASEDQFPTLFMIDIAEMRLIDFKGKMKKFSNYRQTLAFSLNDADPFFNGTGFPLECDDVPGNFYSGVLVYVRKMIFDNAKRYNYNINNASPTSDNAWVYAQDVRTEFAEINIVFPGINGYDFNQFQVNTYYDSLRLEGVNVNRVFPLIIPISGAFIFDKNMKATVLEIRFVVKNFVKKYEHDESVSVVHYYALSDWLRDVHETDGTARGGNLQAVARSYIPGLTGRIGGSCTAGRYIIAIPAGEPITDYTISGNMRAGNICDLPRLPGYPYNGIELLLDYYLNLEKYNYDFNQKVPSLGTCTDFSVYQTAWNTYADGVTNFKVPPLAVYTTGTNYTIENVPPGTYDVYMSSSTPNYGELFYDGNFSSSVTNVVVPIGGPPAAANF